MEKKLCYKVVMKHLDDKLYSLTINKGLKECIEYKIGEWVEPHPIMKENGYYILAFEDYDKAKFWHDETLTRLFLAEYDEKVEPMPYPLVGFQIIANKLCYISKNRKGWPEGTIMVKRIKLIKEL